MRQLAAPQSWAVLSPDPDAADLLSVETPTDSTDRVRVALERLQRSASSNVPEPDRLVRRAETTDLPSKEKATEFIEPVWLFSVSAPHPKTIGPLVLCGSK